MPKPKPESSSAIATTMPNSETCSAKNEVFSAVVSAVSVTQSVGRAFATGCARLRILRGGVASFVSLPSCVRKRPIWEYVLPPVDSSVWMRM